MGLSNNGAGWYISGFWSSSQQMVRNCLIVFKLRCFFIVADDILYK